MIRWLYRYVFRGIGILLVIGVITILFLAIGSQQHRSAHRRISADRGGER